MSSDFAEIWYTKVFEGSESKINVKMLVRAFLDKKTYVFREGVPKKLAKLKSCPISMKIGVWGFSNVLSPKIKTICW